MITTMFGAAGSAAGVRSLPASVYAASEVAARAIATPAASAGRLLAMAKETLTGRGGLRRGSGFARHPAELLQFGSGGWNQSAKVRASGRASAALRRLGDAEERLGAFLLHLRALVGGGALLRLAELALGLFEALFLDAGIELVGRDRLAHQHGDLVCEHLHVA